MSGLASPRVHHRRGRSLSYPLAWPLGRLAAVPNQETGSANELVLRLRDDLDTRLVENNGALRKAGFVHVGAETFVVRTSIF